VNETSLLLQCILTLKVCLIDGSRIFARKGMLDNEPTRGANLLHVRRSIVAMACAYSTADVAHQWQVVELLPSSAIFYRKFEPQAHEARVERTVT
jgi:hypothetical protein